jgi:hypothetical protein
MFIGKLLWVYVAVEGLMFAMLDHFEEALFQESWRVLWSSAHDLDWWDKYVTSAVAVQFRRLC